MLRVCLRIGHDRSVLGVVAGFLILLASYGAPAAILAAQPAPGPAKRSLSSFNEQWAKLVATAKREGNLMVNGGPSWQMPGGPFDIVQAFSKKFGIKARTGRGSGGAQAQRMLAERRSGVYSVDLVISGANTFTATLLPAGALEPVRPSLIHPEVVDQTLWKGGVHHYADPQQRHVFIFAGRSRGPSISINTNLVRIDELKTYWDLLHPKWRGKIVAIHPRHALRSSTFSNIYYDKEAGPEFLRRIYSERGLVYVSTTREMADGLASGAYAIAFQEAGATRDIGVAEAEGLPVARLHHRDAVFGTETTRQRVNPGGAGMLGMVNNAPNPHALRLFVNWFLTREVQLMFNQAHTEPAGGEYESLRRDVPNDAVNPLYRIPEPFYMDEADPQFVQKDKIASQFMRDLIEKLGL